MKNLLLPLILLGLTSCSTRFQLFDVDSVQVREVAEENVFIYENDSLEIIYDLWTDGGTLLYRIENKLDRPLYVAMDRSYFGINRDKINYYRPQAQDEAQLAPPNPDLVYSPYGRYHPLVKIPAQEGRWLEGFPITYDIVRVRRGEPTVFDPVNSPLRFANYLALSWQEQPRQRDFREIRHDFWIARVNMIPGKELRRLEASDLNKTDKFYVSQSPEQRPEEFWVEIGLSVLENILYLLAF